MEQTVTKPLLGSESHADVIGPSHRPWSGMGRRYRPPGHPRCQSRLAVGLFRLSAAV